MSKKNSNIETDVKHLVRIVNTDIVGTKPVLFGLTKIKGIGIMYSNAILGVAGVDKIKKVGLLNESEISKIEDIIKNTTNYPIPVWMYNRRKDYETGNDMHLITSDLDFTQENDLKRLKKIKSNRGLRHAWGLPVRGQRTKSNFRRNKGKVAGVKRKK
jgi:small subunit ribosomal protein S13